MGGPAIWQHLSDTGPDNEWQRCTAQQAQPSCWAGQQPTAIFTHSDTVPAHFLSTAARVQLPSGARLPLLCSEAAAAFTAAEARPTARPTTTPEVTGGWRRVALREASATAPAATRRAATRAPAAGAPGEAWCVMFYVVNCAGWQGWAFVHGACATCALKPFADAVIRPAQSCCYCLPPSPRRYDDRYEDEQPPAKRRRYSRSPSRYVCCEWLWEWLWVGGRFGQPDITPQMWGQYESTHLSGWAASCIQL